MKRILYCCISFLAVCFFALSCNVEEKGEGAYFRGAYEAVYASIGDTDVTKVYADGQFHVLWEEGDCISVFNKFTDNQKFSLHEGAGTDSGVFNVDGDNGVSGTPLPAVWAFYPYSEDLAISSEGVISKSFPAVQDYVAGTFSPGANAMVSASADNRLQFKNLGAVLVLKLYGEDVTVNSVSLRGNGNEILCGAAAVCMEPGGTPRVDWAGETGTELTLSCETPVSLGTSAESATEFWFVLPPVCFDGGISITVSGPSGSFIKSSSNKVALGRSQIGFMPPLEVTLVKEATKRIKSLEDFISFRDNLGSYSSEDLISLDADITINSPLPMCGSMPAVFDGNGHSITYSVKGASNSSDSKFALFSNVSGTVRNLKVAGSVTVSLSSSSTRYIGGVCGYAESSAVFENCSSSVELLADTRQTHYMGGIAGYAESGTKFIGCANSGRVAMVIDGLANASQLGGIIGHLEGGGEIQSCTNDGEIYYQGGGTPRIGGMCGYLNGISSVKISKCTNNGALVCRCQDPGKSQYSYVGGITGFCGSPVSGASFLYEDCVNNGKLELDMSFSIARVRAGGIACFAGKSGVADASYTWSFKNCENHGGIISSCSTVYAAFGGILGYAETSALVDCDGCTNDAPVSAEGEACVGGITGQGGSVSSRYTNFTVTEKTALKTLGAAGMAIGYPSKLTTALTGKIRGGSINSGSEIIDIKSSNYTNYVVGSELGSGGSISGVVFDGNQSGVDSGPINGTSIQSGNDLVGLVYDETTGQGIAGVVVSDGYDCVETDANGVYQFKSNSLTRLVFISTPAEYQIPVSLAPSTPVFHKIVTPDGSIKRNDFALRPLEGGKETSWTFIGIGDPQCPTASTATRYSKETIADIRSTLAGRSHVYAMTLGDIVFDSTDMWPSMKASMSSVSTGNWYIPFFQTIGNHDHDSLKPDTADDAADDYNATSTFVKNFGPVDYSFNRGDVHVVSMDDIIVSSQKESSRSNKKTWVYDRGFSDQQLEWLRKDLSLVPDKANKMVFICCHIPFKTYTVNHYPDVLNLLTQFKEAHIMIGHTHYTQNYIHTGKKALGGMAVYEHIHGSACGAWWTTTSSSTVSGEPSGYTIYDIEGAHIKDWHLKGTNKPEDFQLRVFDGNEIYYNSGSYPLNWYTPSQSLTIGSNTFAVKGYSSLKGCFVVQVFNDDSTYWKVSLYKKSTGTKIGDFTRIADGKCSNAAMSAFYYNVKGKTTDSYRSYTASHYWLYKPASAAPADETDWEVVVTHTLPAGDVKHTYKCSTLTKESDFSSTFYF